MQLSITFRHMEPSEAMRKYAEKKLNRIIKRHSRGLTELLLVLSIEKHRNIAELIVRGRNLLLSSQEETDDMFKSIDGVIDKIERQLKKFKEKIREPKGVLPEELSTRTSAVEAENVSYRILEKKYQLKPMSVDEAVLNLNISGEDFIVFTNSNTNMVNLLRKVGDNTYELIEPELY